MALKNKFDRQVIAWALYDWANSGFATTVMVGFFPLFFKQYWSTEVDATVSTFQFGITNSIASLVIMLISPVLGALADKFGAQKRFLLFFTLLGVVGTALLYFVDKGDWRMAALLYALASIGFMGGITFYNALMMGIARHEDMHQISALGFALGYLGGGVLFALNVFMVMDPAVLGLPDTPTAIKLSFVSVSLWWALFSVPLFWYVREPPVARPLAGTAAIRAGLKELGATLKEARRFPLIVTFLIAYFLYIDAADTVAVMAVDFGMALGFDTDHLILALLITQGISFPSALAFGWFGQRYGPKPGIFLGIGAYMAVTVYAFFMDRAEEFYVLAAVVGLVQGGLQSLSRSLYACIIPKNKAGEFFGFFSMWSKFSVVIGPALVGWVSVATGNPRYSILAILVLFLAGAGFLYFVNVGEAERRALEMEKETP
jgi:UMF1 family MFS transporter